MAPFVAFHKDAEESAEAFVMRRMDLAEAASYQAHLLNCPDCAKKVREAQAFVGAMHSAALDHVTRTKQ
jgi:hypothetical protein